MVKVQAKVKKKEQSTTKEEEIGVYAEILSLAQEAMTNAANGIIAEVSRVAVEEKEDKGLALFEKLAKMPICQHGIVLQHDHAGFYIQVRVIVPIDSESKIADFEWRTASGVYSNPLEALLHAERVLIESSTPQPPKPITPDYGKMPEFSEEVIKEAGDQMISYTIVNKVNEYISQSEDSVREMISNLPEIKETKVPSPAEMANKYSVTLSKQASKELEADLEGALEDHLENLLGKQVSAKKKFHGGLTDTVAGKFIGKNYTTGSGIEYGVEYKDSKGRTRLIAVKPETVMETKQIIEVPPLEDEEIEGFIPLEQEVILRGGQINAVADVANQF